MTTVTTEKNASPPDQEDPEGEGMTFWEHLDELRSRLVKMVIATCAGGGAAWYYRSKILGWLLEPFKEAWTQLGLPNEPQLNFPDPAGMFVAYLRLSLISGVVFAMPILFYQIWAFVAPGLYSREKRFAIPFVVASTGLFAAGAFFGMKFAFPVAFHYLLSFAGSEEGFTINPNIMVGDYVQFITQMILVFGGMFELPVLAFFLTVAGIIDHTHLIKFFRYFVVLAFVLGAILTPPDLLSQFLMAVPLVLLYTLSIGIAYVFSKTKNKQPKT
jgi:sec-independent protein translocase protein TatC